MDFFFAKIPLKYLIPYYLQKNLINNNINFNIGYFKVAKQLLTALKQISITKSKHS